MKTKNFNKKLILKKETIADLNQEEMSRLQAGLGVYGPETWGVDGYGEEICPNGTTCLDSRCPIETCTCKPV
ncbi:MAG: hypothetical protein GTO45_37300 [Candidatus Aminicenantes bacterium]|nr:hypothetical protein [Candidatus Aminicenantes bacterium]NIM84323.1 hypothetical protein [Candidatus Aminicenantes bacterium]NIN23809.1 hypothetical protein [Candidatus Aminicenantes bacterium]NIN47525.1 hypothetical protein [Candidatus Aminicenantes bacterium]NIN90445.1 hypothetical protein [Candidatus Aminicenantes bacterium]